VLLKFVMLAMSLFVTQSPVFAIEQYSRPFRSVVSHSLATILHWDSTHRYRSFQEVV